jgi:Xaa-Pro aminopeptidase
VSVFATRRGRAAALAGDRAFVTRDLAAIRYLSGFSGSNATMVLSGYGGTLITDGRYQDQAREETDGVAIVIERDAMAAVLAMQLTALDVDPQMAVHEVEVLRSAGLHVQVAGRWLRDLRTTKDEGELASLERACDITSRALAALATELSVGQSEVAIARRLETLFADLGADDRAFRTIVASGPNAAIPHHQPTNRVLQVGDLVVVDCGALVDGYHADMTRTFCVAAEPTPWQREVHGVVLAAQQAGIAAAMPGASAREVDQATRAVIDAAGFGGAFTHGTGHGVGLQIHEPPMITPGSADNISAGSPITVEPGIYVPGRGGVRIEDTIVVGSPARVLTKASGDLMVVG